MWEYHKHKRQGTYTKDALHTILGRKSGTGMETFVGSRPLSPVTIGPSARITSPEQSIIWKYGKEIGI